MTFAKIRHAGFTLVELLIVVIILSILAAIVIPQFSNSAADARIGALDSNLATMRSAIELYRQQHGVYPGANLATGGTAGAGAVAGTGAVNTEAAVVSQLTMYTDVNGAAVTGGDLTIYRFGPYLKRGIPAEPVTNSSAIAISTAGVLNMVATGTTGGWLYDVPTGQLIANTTALAGH